MFSVSPDILLLGFVAGFVLFRLFSLLGKKDNDGDAPVMKKSAMPGEMIDVSSTAKEEEIRDLGLIDQKLAPGFEAVVAQIKVKDPSFSLQKFLDGAKAAFEMILTAFAKDDRDILKELLDDVTYKQFISEIDGRLKNQVTLDLTLVSLPVVEIRKIKFELEQILIDVFYESQQINILRNDKGNIIEGSLSQIDHMEDTWTFAKTLQSKNNWQLVKVNAS